MEHAKLGLWEGFHIAKGIIGRLTAKSGSERLKWSENGKIICVPSA